MYGLYTYIYHKNQPNVGRCGMHGSYGRGDAAIEKRDFLLGTSFKWDGKTSKVTSSWNGCCETTKSDRWHLWCNWEGWCMSGWWFQIFFYFHPYSGTWPNLTNIFHMGWSHQLDVVGPSYPTRPERDCYKSCTPLADEQKDCWLFWRQHNRETCRQGWWVFQSSE